VQLQLSVAIHFHCAFLSTDEQADWNHFRRAVQDTIGTALPGAKDWIIKETLDLVEQKRALRLRGDIWPNIEPQTSFVGSSFTKIGSSGQMTSLLGPICRFFCSLLCNLTKVVFTFAVVCDRSPLSGFVFRVMLCFRWINAECSLLSVCVLKYF